MPDPDPLRCSNCGTPLSPGARFCENCGKAVAESGRIATRRRSRRSAGLLLIVPTGLLVVLGVTFWPRVQSGEIVFFSGSQIRTLTADGRRAGTLGVAPQGYHYQFSRDLRRVAFLPGQNRSDQILVWTVGRQDLKHIALGSIRVYRSRDFAWSPDGRLLAFMSDPGAEPSGSVQVHIVHIDSGTLTRLTSGPGQNWDPEWSPDGRHIVFASTLADGQDLVVARADGSSRTKEVF